MIRRESSGAAQAAIVAQIAIAFTWAGLVLGLSFIETPLKFQAPGISVTLGVGIGRLVFTALNRIEVALTAILFGMLWVGRRGGLPWRLFSIVAAVVLAQTFWLLPLLDARAQLLLDGAPVPSSFHHLLFVGMEGMKLLALFAMGIAVTHKLVSSSGK